MNESGFCIWTPIVLLVLWIAFSTMVGGGKTRQQDDRRYDIERRQDETLATTSRDETPMQIRARAARIEDAVRAKKPRQALLYGRYPGLLEEPKVETVYGEVVDDPQLPSGAPQLGSGAPQLPSGESRAIAKSKWRGW